MSANERDLGPVEFVDLPAPVRIQLAVFGPLLVGMIAGFLISESEPGYWGITVLATIGGVLAGLEHPGAKPGAIRGFIGGFCFGLGIVIATAIADNPHLVETTHPQGVIIIVTTIAGVALGALGGVIAGRIKRA